MTDLTLGIIYALKQSNKSWNKAVADFMSNYSGSPVEIYDEYKLYRILKEAYIDYLSTCDKPHNETRQFIEMLENYPIYSRAHLLANCLSLTRVKNNEQYINGFRDKEE